MLTATEAPTTTCPAARLAYDAGLAIRDERVFANTSEDLWRAACRKLARIEDAGRLVTAHSATGVFFQAGMASEQLMMALDEAKSEQAAADIKAALALLEAIGRATFDPKPPVIRELARHYFRQSIADALAA